MGADLTIHVFDDNLITLDDLAVFFSNSFGSKYFDMRVARDHKQWTGAAIRIEKTPRIAIGEVSWLKAAVTGDTEEFRVVERGGVWWLERFQDGAWTLYSGPYKRRAGAETRLRRKSSEEVQ